MDLQFFLSLHCPWAPQVILGLTKVWEPLAPKWDALNSYVKPWERHKDKSAMRNLAIRSLLTSRGRLLGTQCQAQFCCFLSGWLWAPVAKASLGPAAKLSRTGRIWDVIFLQANKLGCHSFVDSGRRPETPWSETKELITHSTTSSWSFMFALIPLALPPHPSTTGTTQSLTQLGATLRNGVHITARKPQTLGN